MHDVTLISQLETLVVVEVRKCGDKCICNPPKRQKLQVGKYGVCCAKGKGVSGFVAEKIY